MQVLENKTFDELKIGDHAEITRTLSEQDIEWFAIDSMIAYGGWGGSLVSAMLSSVLPGPGTIYVRHTLNFHQPVGLGDSITVKLVVKDEDSFPPLKPSTPKSRRLWTPPHCAKWLSTGRSAAACSMDRLPLTMPFRRKPAGPRVSHRRWRERLIF